MTTATDEYRAELLAAALDYAARGWHVFPLRRNSKKPATPGHPAHLCDGSDPKCSDGHTGWEQRATIDPVRIERAWTQRPYGIGIACGPSGLLVVDLDRATDGGPSGVESFAHLEHRRRVVLTRTVATPSAGRHRYYTRPDGLELRNTTSRLGPRIDTRASGGYVVAPPTRTGVGRYLLTCGNPVAEAPDWLIELLTEPGPPAIPTGPVPPPADRPGPASGIDATSEGVRRYVVAAIDGEIRRVRDATEGQRNRSLFLAAIALGQLVGAGVLDEGTAERVLWAQTELHVSVGAYSRSQAAATIASGLNRGKTEPRQLPANLAEQVPA